MPSTDWKEDVAPDEATRFEQYAQLIATIQGANAKDGVVSRGLHAKQNVGVEATLEIGDVPADARHGLFAKPGSYKAVVRFSNGAPKKQSDRTLDVRGIAVKVFGVDGKKVIPGLEDATTQDFLAIRTSSLPIRDAAEFMTLVKYSRPQALLPLRLAFSLGLILIIVGGAGGTYVPARTGDFDGDGRAEVIYENPSRNMWRWALPAGGGVQASEVGTPATGWTVLTW